MIIKPQFVFEVSGNPLPEKDIERFVVRVSQRAAKLDPNVKSDYKHFARITYSFRWYGNLVNLGYIDTFHNQIVRYANQYLSNWKLNIKVNYIEEEIT